jgi:hypothetical protein
MQARLASYDSRMLDTLPALLLYFVFLALTLVVGSRVIQGPWLFLLRSFFPNWRFYHRVGQQALLQWRLRAQAVSGPGDGKVAQQDWGAWQSVLPRAQRQLSHLLYNPHVNLKLANQNQLDHLVADLRESSDTAAVSALVSYQLVQRIASQAAQQAATTAATHWQFRVLLLPPYTALINDGNTLQADADPHAVLRSPVLPWQGT